MRDLRALWADATRLYDDPGNGLQVLARDGAWRGFGAGAAWMRSAMGVLRGSEPRGGAHFGRLGSIKYSLASSAALLVLVLLWPLPMLAVPAAIVAFYAVEVRLVFAFPLELDGEPAPLLASHGLLARTLPAGVATVRVMRIAARMSFGGFAGGGFLRSWCLGCLTVVLWYEDARQAVGVTA